MNPNTYTLSLVVLLICTDTKAEESIHHGILDVVKSSVAFTHCTEQLDAKNYQSAADYCERAVELDPDMAKNHNTLASAYYELGRIQEGWLQVRKAVNLAPNDEYAKRNFFRYFLEMKKRTNLADGDSMNAVKEKLGEPDGVVPNGERTWWRYGHVALDFRDGLLIGAANMGVR